MTAADVMTKALSGQSFQRALEMLSIALLRGRVENIGVKQRACSAVVNYGNG
jgi:NifU-like protein involved in Fe-S cluster formation